MIHKIRRKNLKGDQIEKALQLILILLVASDHSIMNETNASNITQTKFMILSLSVSFFPFQNYFCYFVFANMKYKIIIIIIIIKPNAKI